MIVIRQPPVLFVAPMLLSVLFCATAIYYGVLSGALAMLVAVYTFVPTVCIYAQIAMRAKTPSLLDFIVILMLWLPLELSAGASLVPRSVQGVLHATAYGIAITLGVFLFLIARQWDGMKYNLFESWRDLRNITLGYASAFVLIIPFGLWIGFLPAPHGPRVSLEQGAFRFLLTFFGTALPEEILFRVLIQNWILHAIRQPWLAVAISALIFGVSHLNNAPGPLPNWRYMAVATIAGAIFGTLFLRSTSIFASVAVHAAVNTTKHLFF
ncbi:MAG: CPBP family intramembrane metalloprotease [Acidobacteriaceae bacterium]|nr:CPBP family intramembrane metalloprotease [Acidobacteriaceae bacterium]MBV9778736.1 CPBP family intramembrane metalloprotease [Acidobacteriaceae bacterium]